MADDAKVREAAERLQKALDANPHGLLQLLESEAMARHLLAALAAPKGECGWTGCDCKEPCGLKQDELSSWDYCPNCDHAPKCHAARAGRV